MLLLDEPCAGVDVHSTNLIIAQCRRALEKGASILFTSHSMRLCERICDRLFILHNGEKIAETTPTELNKLKYDNNNAPECTLIKLD